MSAHPIRCQKLLTGIRGNAILRLSRYERGFHDGNVWGPFSFAAVLSCSRIRLHLRPLSEALILAVAREPRDERWQFLPDEFDEFHAERPVG